MIEFENSEILNFINSDVPSYQRETLLKSLNSNSDSIDFYNEIGKELTGELNSNNLLLQTGPVINKTSFWEKVKDEVYLFICTDVEKYSTERNLMGKNFKEVTTIVATAIAGTFSLGTGVIVGIVTNVLISVVKVNKNAWCELQKPNNSDNS
ncbi:hypothetical protein [Flavobacterium frigoris]|uniref:Uncharacterized protein n=1 Tax=Flavobacterium frigoris (strain PS1) TaxID=1086011 RepID=H7FSS7_FLAFP|nr:hypothetical protein [Flavobacterium frigoris]EIA08636.1 hypothetical protein HJ01_02358 [Flavobacterium frigoris PS1]